ncbi:MAG TPA: DUF4255 domain-containing protein [Acidobacteriaceae bacterium]|jgi:hypothetical protein|nr:DUF4255 domain-containing protein [Acidobacteriaceae bacterium]
MSDYLAVAGVSAVLKSLLTTALSSGGPSGILGAAAGITNIAPDLIATGSSEAAQINLFLYYASINSALRNLDLPSSGAGGNRLTNPPLAINLHYLVTAYGSQPFDAEILLAWAMKVFHDTPVVPRTTIQQALADLLTVNPVPTEQQLVSASTLSNQVEHIRITPEALTTEEIYRLWTAFQTSYRPTTSYQISVVVIQDTQSYTSNLPVQRRSVLALPLITPVIDTVSPTMVTSGGTLTLNGSNFLGDTPAATQVSFDGGAGLAPATVQGSVLRVVVPTSLFAGTHSVRALRSVTYPSSPTPHPGFSSSPVPFQLVPTIQPAATPPITATQGSALTLTVSPQVGVMQKAVVYIGDQAIPVPDRPLAGPASSAEITVPVPSTVAVGTFPLRVEVDGAQSRLALDTTSGSPTYGQWLPQIEVSA